MSENSMLPLQIVAAIQRGANTYTQIASEFASIVIGHRWIDTLRAELCGLLHARKIHCVNGVYYADAQKAAEAFHKTGIPVHEKTLAEYMALVKTCRECLEILKTRKDIPISGVGIMLSAAIQSPQQTAKWWEEAIRADERALIEKGKS